MPVGISRMQFEIQEVVRLFSKDKRETQDSRSSTGQLGKAFGKLLPKKGGSEIGEGVPRVRKYSRGREREEGGGKSMRTEKVELFLGERNNSYTLVKRN